MKTKAQLKLSNLMIAVVLVGMFAMFLWNLIGSVQSKYGTSQLSQDDIEVFNKMANISDVTSNTQSSLENYTQPTGILDTIGGYFTAGYNAVKVAGRSVDTTKEVIELGAQKAQIPGYIKTGLLTILMIVIIVGIYISTITKRES